MGRNPTKPKGKGKSKSKGDRPPIDIPEEDVLNLAEIGCTNVEIAGFFKVDESTIRKRFPEILTKGRESGKIRLRKKQFSVAMKGNVSMLIWLGKQILGQKDKTETEHGEKDSLQILIDTINAYGNKIPVREG